MKKRCISIISAFICILLLNSVALARTYNIGMIHWIAYSPLNIADVKGFWKEQNLDVKVTNFGSNQELNTALINKRIDIALDMIGSWVGLYISGVPLKVIGETDWSYGGDKIIAKENLDPNSLKGSKIGIYLNQPSVTYFLSKYLQTLNLKLSDVSVIELEPEAMSDNFIASKFNVIVNYDPQALRAVRDGKGKVVATSASWDGVIPEGFVSIDETLKNIPEEDLKKFFRGWFKAVAWSKDPSNWDEYKTILNKYTFEGENPYSDADLKGMIDSVRVHDKATSQKINNTNGSLSKYITDLHAFLRENDLLTKDFTVDEILDNKVLHSVSLEH